MPAHLLGGRITPTIGILVRHHKTEVEIFRSEGQMIAAKAQLVVLICRGSQSILRKAQFVKKQSQFQRCEIRQYLYGGVLQRGIFFFFQGWWLLLIEYGRG